eukprot:6488270-Amphidinium_carterae.1
MARLGKLFEGKSCFGSTCWWLSKLCACAALEEFKLATDKIECGGKPKETAAHTVKALEHLHRAQSVLVGPSDFQVD